MSTQRGIVGRPLIIPLNVAVSAERIKSRVQKNGKEIGSVEIRPLSSDHFQLIYIPQEEGALQMEVLIDNKVSSTFTVVVEPTPSIILKTPQRLSTIVGHKVVFRLQAPSFTPSMVQAEFRTNGQVASAAHVSSEIDDILISFVPQTTGLFLGTVKLGQETMQAQLEIESISAPAIQLIEGHRSYATVGRLFHFSLSAPGYNSNQLVVKILSPMGGSEHGKVTAKSDGVFDISFTPTLAGEYSAEIVVDGALVSKPQIIDARPDVKWIDMPRNAGDIRVGKPFEFIFQIEDVSPDRLSVVFIELGRWALDVEKALKSHCVLNTGKVTATILPDNKPLSDPVRQLSLAIVTIKLNLFLRQASNIIQASEPTAQFSDSAIRQGPVGGEFNLHLKLEGISAGTASAPVFDSESKQVDTAKVTKTSSNGFTLSWTPSKPGKYTLRLQVDGAPVAGSEVQFEALPIPTCRVLQSEVNEAEGVATIKVAIDGYTPQTLTANATGSDGTRVAVSTKRTSDGFWQVSLRPPKSPSFSIEFLADGRQVGQRITIELGS